MSGTRRDLRRARAPWAAGPRSFFPAVLLAALAGCASMLPPPETEQAGTSIPPQAAPATPTHRAGTRDHAAPVPEGVHEPEAQAAEQNGGPRRQPTSSAPMRAAPEAAGVDEASKTPAPPPDLWARLRRGFGLPDHDHPRVEAELRWYREHPEYLDRVAERARPFLRYILEQVEQRNMPTEIALLPVVESAFQPFAYSHGRAAGIWQIIPGTGRRFGLKQNWWYDGRRDVIASTRAALDYLQQLHRAFDKDWLLALAAYNAGEGNVRRAIRNNRRRNRPTDFWHLKLSRETRGYVPKLLALAALVADPERHGITLKPIPNEPQIAVVEVGSQIDLALAADMAGISVETLYRLNPGFNRWATDPDGPHRLLLPIDKMERLREKLAALPPEKRIRWVRHRIRPGETLSHIAHRYRTSVALLRRVNRLRGTTIRAGRHLVVPVAARAISHYRLSVEQRLRRIKNTPRGARKVVHVVRPGDTLWDIARSYGVPVGRLAKWNGIAPRDYLKPGQRLVIWLSAKAGIPAGGMLHVSALLGNETLRLIHYVVRPGDSLSRISRRFNVSVADLRRWNALPEGAYLQPGQHLKLYVDVTRQSEGEGQT